MLDPNIRETIITLSNKGESHREISKILRISKTTVRKIIKEGTRTAAENAIEKHADIVALIKSLYIHCKGNVVRIQEKLAFDYKHTIAYSSLTRIVREHALRDPPKRAGHYVFSPGEEMQHDTSPHVVMLGDKKMKLQCASLVFAYSRRLFIQYYERFTRFEAKIFLSHALQFFDGSCKRCVVDNTSVILASGSGANAIMAVEMESFARIFSFHFKAHEIGHADRKAHVERNFYYAEMNFLAGREFVDLVDLNAQAIQWCLAVDKKEKRQLGMSPIAAFIQEKFFLQSLPAVLPPVYEYYQRTVDTQGYINLETHRYSVPEKLLGKTLEVYKYNTLVRVFYQHQEVATHSRITDKRFGRSIVKGHHIKKEYQKNNEAITQTMREVIGTDDIIKEYVAALQKRAPGRGMRVINRLLYFKRTYPRDAFITAITAALKYGLYDLTRLEAMILERVAGVYFNLNLEE